MAFEETAIRPLDANGSCSICNVYGENSGIFVFPLHYILFITCSGELFCTVYNFGEINPLITMLFAYRTVSLGFRVSIFCFRIFDVA